MKPQPVVSVVASKTEICAGEEITLTASGADTYVWSGTGVAAGTTGSTLTVSPTATITYQVAGTTNTCQSVTQKVTITVTPALTQGTITSIREYCQNATPSALTATVSGGVSAKVYLWEQSTTGTDSWAPADGTNNTASYLPSTATAGTMYYRRTITSGSCTSVGEPVAVVVSPAITNNTILSGAQTICSGTPVALLDGATASGATDLTYLWEQSTTGTGSWVAADQVNNAEDYQPATQTVIATTTTYYRRKVVSGFCTNYSDVVSVKITAMPVATILEGSNTYFCSPGTAVLTAPSGTNYTYAWFKEEGDTDAPAGTDRSINVSIAGQYYVIVTQVTDGNSCSTTSAPITVEETIVGNNIINSQDQLVCYGATPVPLDGSEATSTLGTVSYQWQVSSNGTDFTNIASAAGGIGVDLMLGAHTADRWYRRIAKVGSCTNVSDETIKISVLPQIVNTLTTPNQTICLNSPIETITGNPASGGDGTYTYAWYQKTGNGNWEVAPAPNNGVSYDPQIAATAGTYAFRRDVISGTCAPVESNIVTVTVQPAIAGNTIAGTTDYCQGATATALTTNGTLSGGNSSSYTYVWQQSTTETGPWTNAAGTATGASYTPSTATGGTTYYRRLVSSGQCANGESNVLKVVVTPSVVNSISTTITAYCQNTAATTIGGAVSGGNGDGTYTYVWQESAAASGPWTTISTATGADYTPVTTTAGTRYYKRIVTSGNCANKESNVVAITVTPAIVNVISGTSSYCQNAVASAIGGAVSGGTGTYTYSWQVKSGVNGTWGPVSGNTATLVPATAQAGEFYYKRIVTSGACVGAESNEFKVTVVPSIVNTLAGAATYSYCQNAVASAITGTVSGGDGTYTYLWEKSATGTGSWTAASGTNNQPNYTPATTTVGTTYYRRTVTSGVCATPVSSQVITVTVNPNPTVTVTSPAVCAGNSTTITATVSSGTAPYTYIWTVPAGVTNPGNVASFSASIAGTYSVVVKDSKSCSSASGSTNFTVNPLPTMSFTGITDGQVVYSGDGNYALTGSPAGGTFSGPGVTGTTFNTCAAGAAGTKTITYTYTNASGCKNTVSKTVTLKKSVYKVIVVANPFPFCQGENVTYTAKVYRDAEVIYPYLANDKGQPVDKAGNLIPTGAGSFPIANDQYPFPAGTPDIIKAQAYRYYQPIVKEGTGVLLDPSLFTYQWTKNEKVDRKNGAPVTDDAGLSSQDYYGVKVSSKSGALCDAVLDNQMSYRMYSADVPDYTVTLAASPNPICISGSITFTATLAASFPYWSIANVRLEWVLKRGSTLYSLGTVPYSGSNTLQLTTDAAAAGGYVNGDQVYVNIYSDIDAYVANTKCAGKAQSTPVTIVVDQPATLTADLSTTSQAKCEGDNVTYTASATGTGISFAWYRKNADGSSTLLSGSKYSITNTTATSGTTSTLAITGLAVSDAGSYYVTVSNSTTSVCQASVTSAISPLVVNPYPLAFTAQSGSYCPQTSTGTPIVLSDSETGVNYQLVRLPAENVKTMAGTGDALNFGLWPEGSYKIVASNGSSCLREMPVPDVVKQPVLQFFAEIKVTPTPLKIGDPATFTANATNGGTALTYQWYKYDNTANNFVKLANETAQTYTIAKVEDELVQVKVEVTADGTTCVQNNVFAAESGQLTPLPVEIIYLRASKQANDVLLEWATAQEKDNTGFEVQVSEDGKVYRKLTFIPTRNGNAAVKQVYEFRDRENGKHGTRYYRLKQVDVNGTFEFFGPKVVTFDAVADNIKVYPNPFSSEITLDIAAVQDGELLITVHNAVGKQLLQRKVHVKQGLTSEKLQLGDGLPQGVYFITTQLDGHLAHFKLLRE
ncbi:T9SS type A sorting domain-containing protein [Pontibacter liquoris]|uniref:T9SS type A sorting domain-containing protein n=1 Tax=Pontibacter liquoris TaxID=2905677 RepID=UPI001FA76020|nr:T9SS type A sorting domain-containing protein [Pontibacter liquoris]